MSAKVLQDAGQHVPTTLSSGWLVRVLKYYRTLASTCQPLAAGSKAVKPAAVVKGGGGKALGSKAVGAAWVVTPSGCCGWGQCTAVFASLAALVEVQ